MKVYFRLVNDDGFVVGNAKHLCGKIEYGSFPVAHLRCGVFFPIVFMAKCSYEFRILFFEVSMRKNFFPNSFQTVEWSGGGAWFLLS